MLMRMKLWIYLCANYPSRAPPLFRERVGGFGTNKPPLGVAQNITSGVTQVLVFGSICQGAILVHVFDPQPFTSVLFWVPL